MKNSDSWTSLISSIKKADVKNAVRGGFLTFFFAMVLSSFNLSLIAQFLISPAVSLVGFVFGLWIEKVFAICFFFLSLACWLLEISFFLAYFLVTSEPTCQFQLIYFTCMNLIAFKEGYPGYPPYLLAFFFFFLLLFWPLWFFFHRFDKGYVANGSRYLLSLSK